LKHFIEFGPKATEPGSDATDLYLQVLTQNNGYQSVTAKQLDIRRATL
jgi:hypothetical protein